MNEKQQKIEEVIQTALRQLEEVKKETATPIQEHTGSAVYAIAIIIDAAINELPPNLRYSVTNGLWLYIQMLKQYHKPEDKKYSFLSSSSSI